MNAALLALQPGKSVQIKGPFGTFKYQPGKYKAIGARPFPEDNSRRAPDKNTNRPSAGATCSVHQARMNHSLRCCPCSAAGGRHGDRADGEPEPRHPAQP